MNFFLYDRTIGPKPKLLDLIDDRRGPEVGSSAGVRSL